MLTVKHSEAEDFGVPKEVKHLPAVGSARLATQQLPSMADECASVSAEDGPVRKWSNDSEGFGVFSGSAVVSVHVPAHLKSIIKEEPVLMEFAVASQVELSWSMPPLRERASYLPVGVMVPPDHEMHFQHLEKLDSFLTEVSKLPQRLEQKVAMKRMRSGLGPGPKSVRAGKSYVGKSALQAL